MKHPKWPGLPENTGDPARDNRHRNLNRRVHTMTQQSLRFDTSRGWRRKRVLKRVEGGTYTEMVILTATLLGGFNG